MQNKSKPVYWKKRVGEYRRSMLTMVKWCEVNGESVHKLKYWIDKFRKDGVIFNDEPETDDTQGRGYTGGEVRWLAVAHQCDEARLTGAGRKAGLTGTGGETADGMQVETAAIGIWVNSFKVSVCSGFDKHTLADVVEVLKRC
jgi:hypothetical protein